MKIVQELQEAGYALTVEGSKLKCRWTRTDPPDPARLSPLLNELRRHKDAVRDYLARRPGECDSCPAAGFWDGYAAWGLRPARYCFYEAVYLGKTAKPRKCDERRRDCPRKNTGGQ